MRTIHTFDIELWTEPEEKERAKEQGLDTTQGVFEALKAHLEENGLLPDKRMCRIAAECSLMFNGRGQEMMLSEQEPVIAAVE